MTFWEVIWFICQIPLGIAAIGMCCIVGMVAFIAAAFAGYCVWILLTDRDEEKWKIIGRKWHDGDM